MLSFFKRPSAIVLSCGICLSTAVFSQSLTSGDIVVVGYNFEDPDEFSLLPLVDLPEGMQFYLTDCGWNATANAFRVGEGLLTYTVPLGGINAGHQIHYPVDEGFVKQGINGFFGLSTAGDQLFIFQGSFADPHFIFALSDYNGSWLDSTSLPNNQTSNRPPGLVDGQSALLLNQYIDARFECAYPFSDREGFLTRLTNAANWIKVTGRVDLPIFGCGFDPLLAIPLIRWEYEVENNEKLLLTITEGATEQAISWEAYDQKTVIDMDCNQINKKEYSCQLPSTSDAFYLRPCMDYTCQAYKKILFTDAVVSWHKVEHGQIEVVVKKENSHHFSYALYDASGRTIHEGEQERGTVMLKNLSSGFYILYLELAQVVYRISIPVWDDETP